MLDFLKNTFLNQNRYKTHSEAVIISCFYNPQNNPYRLLAFQKWYHSIKHLNYRIIECLMGEDASQLPNDPNIIQVQTDSVLWHKETLLNKIIAELPSKFKYVFWVDADVLFTNNNWLIDSVNQLKAGAAIIQPFEYCVHLERNQLVPSFDVSKAKLEDSRPDGLRYDPEKKTKRLWRSFCANFVDQPRRSNSENYDVHGHVGFAWGARREVLTQCPLFDRALIGGADHIIAHAAAGQVPHTCIKKGFGDNIEEVLDWSRNFYDVVQGRIAYAPGDLYHIWHGDIAKRQYLKRIKDFTGETTKITERDANGLFVAGERDKYVRSYMKDREVLPNEYNDFEEFDEGFFEDMGYLISDVVQLYTDSQYPQDDSQFQQEYESELSVIGGVNLPENLIASEDSYTEEMRIFRAQREEEIATQNSFESDDAGVVDDGRHIITDDQLEGATISSDYESTDDQTESQFDSDFGGGGDFDNSDSENFS